MINLNLTMDQHSREITRDGKPIGYVMWHPQREPRIELSGSMEYLTISETLEVLRQYEAIVLKERKTSSFSWLYGN